MIIFEGSDRSEFFFFFFFSFCIRVHEAMLGGKQAKMLVWSHNDKIKKSNFDIKAKPSETDGAPVKSLPIAQVKNKIISCRGGEKVVPRLLCFGWSLPIKPESFCFKYQPRMSGKSNHSMVPTDECKWVMILSYWHYKRHEEDIGTTKWKSSCSLVKHMHYPPSMYQTNVVRCPLYCDKVWEASPPLWKSQLSRWADKWLILWFYIPV